MGTLKLSRSKIVLAALFLLFFHSVPGQQGPAAQANSAKELVGLWEAKRCFGPEVNGTLLITQKGNNWRAEIAGRVAPVKVDGDSISFELADGEGKFQGKFEGGRTRLVGHWIQPPMLTNGRAHASPVTLTKDRQNIWRGEVSPLEDEFTFYLLARVRDDGSVGAFLKNPERNLGRFVRIDRMERDGETVRFLSADTAQERGRVLVEGRYDAARQTMSVYFPMGGGTFDFKRVSPNATSDFYPRGHPTATYVYTPPPALDDGWQTASLEDVGISREGIRKFIQMIIDTPIDSVGSQEMHGVLIARYGKLVLEEYFHGEHREKPHDTRSASKSLAATLFGAAMKAGVAVDTSAPVYKVMNGGTFPRDLDPRKKVVLAEHLLTMSPGLDCDDNDPKSVGGEGPMQQQTEQPDWYKYTLAREMVRRPGEKSLYCGGSSNLVGGIVKHASRQSLTVLFHRLLAEPLQIKKYHLQLSPTGDVYFGGGLAFLPRDFMKFGQLQVNGGMWNGRRILTPAWSRRATSHMVNVVENITYNWETKQMVRGARKYGYQWWVEDYPYKGRTLRAFFAGGNGGQIVMGIPELDLVIAFYGGNYSDRASFIPQWVYVPQYILPAIVK